ncbi:hypothetical protein [Gloeobacter morelensis]|uniref:Uncharacterized protein n=1 Tax=Gloeobacter morelensis MG652769 TaxID=2781736 RepID=A0ABY3PIF7_9CYAN|nr:hypothetical protein [Gloeobacter morelensis]UFP93369.1 hypothetical protein ISF26_16395 [Gloeobacter morelensis MG652769]
MTTNSGQPPDCSSRLDRVEMLLARVAEQQAVTQSQVSANAQAITRLEANQAALSERVNIMGERVDTLAESIRVLVPIIQSIQLENRRILDILQQRGEKG